MKGVLLGVAGGDEGDVVRRHLPEVLNPPGGFKYHHICEAIFLEAGRQRIDHALEHLAIHDQRAAPKAERHARQHAHPIERESRSGPALGAFDQISLRHLAQRDHQGNIARQFIDFREGKVFVVNDVGHQASNGIGTNSP